MKLNLATSTQTAASSRRKTRKAGLVLLALVFAAGLAAQNKKFDSDTVAYIGGKEKVSKRYLVDVMEKLKKDTVEAYMRKLDYGTNFSQQVLQIIVDNYILAKLALEEGYHNQPGFRRRLQVNISRFFGEYVARQLVKTGALKKKDQYNAPAINEYLKKKYKLRIFVSGIDRKGIFKVKTAKSPTIDYYGKKFPKVKPLVQATYKKKIAQKHTAVTYLLKGETKEINLRTILDKLDHLTLTKFRSGSAVYRHNVIARMMVADLLATEFKALSEKDPGVTEYIKRIEQMTLAERFRVMKGYSPATPYIAPDVKIIDRPVTEEEIIDYWKKHKRDFARPSSAEVYMLVLDRNQNEVDEGDGFIAELEELQIPLKRAEGDLATAQNRLRQLKKLLKKSGLGDKLRKDYQKEHDELEESIPELKQKLKSARRKTPRAKFEAFKKFMRELNERENRKNGSVQKSRYLGEIKFKKKLKTYENIAFTVKSGNVSTLFDSREGFYCILFVKKRRNIIPKYTDKSTRKRINYRLQELKRKAELDKILADGRPVELPQSDVNWPLLKSIK